VSSEALEAARIDRSFADKALLCTLPQLGEGAG